MFDNKPTRTAMILLEGCVSYIRDNNSTFIIVKDKNGDKKFAHSKQSIALNILKSSKLISPIEILRKVTPFYKSRNEMPHNKIVLFTSVRGVILLKEWAKRDSFKLFFDAYAGHITDNMLDTHIILSKIENNLGKSLIPIWIKGRESLQPREIPHDKQVAGSFTLPF